MWPLGKSTVLKGGTALQTQQWERRCMESTGQICFSRSREQLYNSRFPGQEPADQSCKKERDIQKDKTQLLATEKAEWGRGIIS